MTTTRVNKKVTNKAKRPAIKKLWCAVFFWLPSTVLHAQKIEQGFDAFFKPTKSLVRYYVITEQQGDHWYREAYYLSEKGLAMKGWYKDKDCEIADGETEWYFPNRTLQSQVNYLDGERDGLSLHYYENGMMRDSANYYAGHRKGIALEWNPEGYQTDSTNFDGAGNGVEVKWYSNGHVMQAGRWTNDTIKINRWNYYDPNGKLNATEYYINGKRTSCSCFDADGKQLDSLLCIKEEEAHFPGYEIGWKTFLEKHLNPNVPADNRAPVGTYTVWVQFVVDTDGSIKDVKPLTKFGYGMEAEVVRLIKKSPVWVPAIEFGRNVKAYRKQPVTFSLTK